MNRDGEEALANFMEQTSRTLASHAEALKRLNENLMAAKVTIDNHRACIQTNRADVEGLAKLVNDQNRIINASRDVLVRLYEDRFGADAKPPSSDVN